jgi:glycosyltransferase involved in cell wall biosynthesis
MRKTLIFDLEINGHHTDYLLCLIKVISQKKIEDRAFVFVLPEEFGVRLTSYQQLYLPELSQNISFDYINTVKTQQIKASAQISRSASEWQLYNEKAREHCINEGFLMYFDLFLWGCIRGEKPAVPTSGILFRPSWGNSYSTEDWKARIKNLVKLWRLKTALRKSGINTLFTLDTLAVEKLNSKITGVKFSPIADPVEHYSQIRLSLPELSCSTEKKKLLIFGHLDGRKGIIETINAIATLSESDQRKICLIVAGPLQNDIRTTFYALKSQLKGNLEIVDFDQEFQFDQIQQLFDSADLILASYQKHIGMSSVIIRAAIAEKPILSSDFGLMGDYILKYELGKTVDSGNIKAIAAGIKKYLDEGIPYNRSSQKLVVDTNSPEAFTDVILSFNS